MALGEAIEAEAQAQALCMQHPDFAEAHAAFKERAPGAVRGCAGAGRPGPECRCGCRSDDLPMFFEPAHAELGARLRPGRARARGGRARGRRAGARSGGGRGARERRAVRARGAGRRQARQPLAVPRARDARLRVAARRLDLRGARASASTRSRSRAAPASAPRLASVRARRERSRRSRSPSPRPAPTSRRSQTRAQRGRRGLPARRRQAVHLEPRASPITRPCSRRPIRASARRGLTAFWVAARQRRASRSRRSRAIAPHPIGALALRGVLVAGERADRRGRAGHAARDADARRVPGLGRRGRGRDGAARARRGRSRSSPSASSSASRCPSSRSSRPTSPTWRSISTRRGCSCCAPRTARTPPRGRVTTEVSIAKLGATEAAQRVIDRAVQLFGGRGVMAGAVVEHLYRAIRPLRIYEGTSEIQRTIIGRAGRAMTRSDDAR